MQLSCTCTVTSVEATCAAALGLPKLHIGTEQTLELNTNFLGQIT